MAPAGERQCVHAHIPGHGVAGVGDRIWGDGAANVCGEERFSNDFSLAYEAEVPLVEGRPRLHVFVDRSSVEVLVNDGTVVLTGRVFPGEDSDGPELYTIGGDSRLHSLTVWPLAGIWSNDG